MTDATSDLRANQCFQVIGTPVHLFLLPYLVNGGREGRKRKGKVRKGGREERRERRRDGSGFKKGGMEGKKERRKQGRKSGNRN